jgi:hypothetical protein
VGTRERIIPGVGPIGNTGTSQIFVPANLGHSQFKTGHCNEVDPGGSVKHLRGGSPLLVIAPLPAALALRAPQVGVVWGEKTRRDGRGGEFKYDPERMDNRLWLLKRAPLRMV